MKLLSILLVEDDMIEVMKMKRATAALGLKHDIKEATNGEDALNLLKEGQDLPDIIILDLNMPKVSGVEFLKLLKANDRLNHIPAIVLTTSSNQKDLLECYKIGVSGYILKPLKYDDYVNRIKQLISYWSLNELITY